jgi:hypothetical protein
LAARDSRAAWSSPRAGGALNSEPTTEKRKRAHKAGVDGMEGLVITGPHKIEYTKVKTTVRPHIPASASTLDVHLLRVAIS